MIYIKKERPLEKEKKNEGKIKSFIKWSKKKPACFYNAIANSFYSNSKNILGDYYIWINEINYNNVRRDRRKELEIINYDTCTR